MRYRARGAREKAGLPIVTAQRSARRGGRPPTGSLQWTQDKRGVWRWHARISLTDGSRPLVPLDPAIPQDDRVRAQACATETSAYYREHGYTSEGRRLETVETYVKRWLADRAGRIHSIRDDRGRMTLHVLPLIRRLDVRTFGRDDVERVRDALDGKIERQELSWKTAANCWTLLTTMCSDMVAHKRRELRVREDNPCTNVRAPERGSNKAKQYLYPSEFLKLASCAKVPLRWRRAVALAIYTYLRDGELRVLTWAGDVDLAHGVLSITRAYNRRKPGETKGTKSGDARRFAIEPNLLPLLQAMHRETRGAGKVIRLPSERAMARNLRRWLWKAGVRRAELHKGTPTRKHLTWHDLRATGATWMAVRGDDPLKVMQRCGHRDFGTTQTYIREAEAIREGFGEVFPALPEGLFGLGGSGRVLALAERRWPIRPKTSGSERGGRDSNASDEDARSTGNSASSSDAPSDARSESARDSKSVTVGSSPLVHPPPKATEEELERGILDALKLGLADVARALTSALEARRPANVVRLDAKRTNR